MTGHDKTLHPLDERYVETYAFRAPVAGAADAAASGAAASGAARWCPLCGGELVPTHRQRHGRRYFRHQDAGDDARCPLTTPHYELAGLAVAQRGGPAADFGHRTRFLAGWQAHYRRMQMLAPSLTLERFAILIQCADVLNLWSYRSLDERDLPHLLLVLAGFIRVPQADGGAYWIRFWFDARIEDVGDLWTPAGQAAQLFRVHYREPADTPFPSAEAINSWESILRQTRVAATSLPPVGPVESRTFARLLDRYERERQRRQQERA